MTHYFDYVPVMIQFLRESYINSTNVTESNYIEEMGFGYSIEEIQNFLSTVHQIKCYFTFRVVPTVRQQLRCPTLRAALVYRMQANNIIELSMDFSDGYCLEYSDSITAFAVLILILSGLCIMINFR